TPQRVQRRRRGPLRRGALVGGNRPLEEITRDVGVTLVDLEVDVEESKRLRRVDAVVPPESVDLRRGDRRDHRLVRVEGGEARGRPRRGDLPKGAVARRGLG